VVAVAAVAIFLLATYRAFTIGRVLIRGVYRDRALWTAGTLIALIFLTVASNLPPSNPLSPLSFVLIFVVLFAFVDSSIRVVQETDFFHRTPLRWERVRKPFYVVLIAFLAVGGSLALIEPTNSLLYLVGVLLWFGPGGTFLTYSAAALVVGARRTPDRTMKRFVRMLGFAIICMVLFFTVWIPFAPFSLTVQDLGSLISELFVPAAAYFLYLAVMSLSPVGHVEKDVVSTSKAA
jgi:hypothetical protein